MARRRWRVRLSEAAERDFAAIVQWTAQQFGPTQAVIYRRTIVAALTALSDGPDLLDSQPRDEIRPGLRSLHVARRGRRGRHFILYRVGNRGIIEILRILHDSMEFGRNLPDA